MPSPFPRPAAPGTVPADRLAAVEELHALCRRWTGHIPQNVPYIDLTFAFGFALLGDPTRARRLLVDARAVLPSPVPLSQSGDSRQYNPVSAALVPMFAYRAFEYRVEQALAGQPLAGALPADLRAMLEGIERQAASDPVGNSHIVATYHIARLCEQSSVLEPDDRIDPYARLQIRHGDQGPAVLKELLAAREQGQSEDYIRGLFREATPEDKSARDRLADLTSVLLRELGRGLPAERLDLVIAVLRHATGELGGNGREYLLRQQCELLGRGLHVADGLADQTQALAELFADLVSRFPAEARLELINTAGGKCLRGLQMLGLRAEIERLPTRLRSAVPDSSPDPGKPEADLPWLRSRLVLAAGWLMLGRGDEAGPVLDEARLALLTPGALRHHPRAYTLLARAYVSAVGEGPADAGLPRVAELFRATEPGKITNAFTTAPYFSLLHLSLAEEAVAAVGRMLLEPPP
jgi:hypothetical protein